MINLSIVATHPIQYQIPWFRELTNCGKFNVRVLYGLIPDETQQGIGFGQKFSWDIPVLAGYQWEVLENRAKNVDLGTYAGCDTPTIGNALKSHETDVLIVTGWNSKMLIQAARAARKMGIPVIVRGESNSLKNRSILKKVAHWYLLKMYDRFLSIGKSNRKFYLSYGINQALIFNAPYFVENRRFTEKLGEPGMDLVAARERLKISRNAFCFIYSGKLIPKKHVLDLLNAFDRIVKENPNAYLLIVGDGEHRESLTAYVRDNCLPVVFAGFINQSEIPVLYALSNCLVLASDFDETWGLVVNEAMACRLPAILSDRVGCGADLIKPGQTGYVYRYGDIDDLVKSMKLMMDNPQDCKKMGKNAQSHVIENHDVSITVDATCQAIQSLKLE